MVKQAEASNERRNERLWFRMELDPPRARDFEFPRLSKTE
jgi:hypothetical protein